MGIMKTLGRKLRYVSAARKRRAPRWADIKKFSLKRARSRRIDSTRRRWRRDKLKL
ncbi:MAG: hypothetical protein HY519_00725 [Candidatus Aenigmarchaeota archaeon]|nr:hypothetical protein [Candidatus Aenigmarchaeota archaeon]